MKAPAHFLFNLFSARLSIILLLFLTTISLLSAANCGGVTACNCGDTVTANTVMENDLTACAGNGLIIGANGITLDCARYKITGPGTSGNGIDLSGRSNVAIKNCIVSAFQTGIYISGGSNNAILNSIPSGSWAGIVLDSSSYNQIIDSNVTGGSTGISFNYASYNNITNSNVSGGSNGIYIYTTSSYPPSNNRIINSRVNGGQNGITLHDSSNNIITDSNLTGGDYDLNIRSYDLRNFGSCNNILQNVKGTGGKSLLYYNYSTVIQNQDVSELILCNANGAVVNGVTASQGIIILKTNNAQIINSTATATGSYINGINLWSSSNNQIINSSVNATGASSSGISFQYALNNQIINSNISARAYGTNLDYSSNNNQIINSTIDASSYGIAIFNSLNNQIINSRASSSMYGIYLSSSSNNSIIDSNLSGSTGIYLYVSSNNNRIINTSVIASGYGAQIESASNNQIINSSISSSSNGVYMRGYTPSKNTSIINSKITGAIYFPNLANDNNIINSTVTSAGTAITLSSNNNIINSNISGGNAGISIASSSKDNNIINCEVLAIVGSSSAIIIQSSPGNNSIINSSATAMGNLAYPAFSGIRIESSSNNSIINSNSNSDLRGIYLQSSSNNQIINTNATANRSNGYGIILVSSSNNNQITNSNATATGSSSNGISLYSSSNNQIINSNATGGNNGIYLESSSNVSVTNSTATGSSGAGIYLDSVSNSNVINSVTTGGTGIFIYRSSIQVINCTVTSTNQQAIDIFRASNNQIINTTANGYDAIHIDSSSNNNVTNCIANGGQYGIQLAYGSTSNNIVNSTATGARAIYMHSSSNNNQIINCTANSNYYGIVIESSSNNQVINSKATLTGGSGQAISLTYSASNNKIINSTVNNTGNGYGITIWSSSNNNQIINSTASAGDTGISISSSSNNKVIDSTATGSSGISVDGSYNEITNSTAIAVYYTGSGLKLGGAYNTITNSRMLSPGGYSAVYFQYSSNNNIVNSLMESQRTGAYFVGSSNNQIINSTVNSTDPSIVNIYLFYFYSSSNNNITNTTTSHSQNMEYEVRSEANSNNNNFVDIPISTAYFADAGSSLFAKWSFGLGVQGVGGSNDSVQITINDKNGAQAYSGLTDSNGMIPSQTLTEYLWDSTGKTYYTPHTIIGTSGPVSDIHSVSVNAPMQYTFVMEFDATAPITTASLTGTPGTNDWYTSDVSATLGATDDVSGVNETYICVDQSNTCTPIIGTTATITAEGTNYLRYYSVDNAGNPESWHSDLVKIDKTQPTVAIDTLPQYDGDGAILVSWSASDAAPGSDALSFDVYRNGIIYKTGITETSIQETGLLDSTTYSYYVVAKDWAGLTATSTTASTTIDLYPPSVPDLAPLPQYTKILSVLVDWTESVDPVSGVKLYKLYKNLEFLSSTLYGTTEYNDNAVSKGLEYSYAVSATDNVDHESVKSDSASTTIDTQPPVTTHSIAGISGNDGWYKEADVGITLESSDAVSGVSKIYYKLNNGPQAEYMGTFQLSDGEWTVKYYAVDVAGNSESEKSFIVKVDTQSPVTTDDAPMEWQTENVTVTLSATDSISDVASTYYCVDQTSECTPTTSGTSVLVSQEGISFVRYSSTDVAGNIESIRNALVRIDKSPPITTASYDYVSNVGGVYSSDVTVALSADDSYSGVASTIYQIDEGAWTTYTDPISFACDINCTYTLSYNSEDNVDHIEDIHTEQIFIDKRNANVTITNDTGGIVTNIIGDATLVIPAGALPEESADITIETSIHSFAPSVYFTPISQPYDFGPEGIVFTEPVTVTMNGDCSQGEEYFYLYQCIAEWDEEHDEWSCVVSDPGAESGFCPDFYGTGATTCTVPDEPYNRVATWNFNAEDPSQCTLTTQTYHFSTYQVIQFVIPTTTAILMGTEGGNGWFLSAVAVQVTATDLPPTGRIEYSVNGVTGFSELSPVVFMVETEGINTVTYRAVAGRAEQEHSIQVKIDQSAPVTTPYIIGTRSNNDWWISTLIAMLEAIDR